MPLLEMTEELFSDITDHELDGELKKAGFNTYHQWFKDTNFITGNCVFNQFDTGSDLKELLKDTNVGCLSEKALFVLWRKFSEIQHATWMGLNIESKEAFMRWVVSGKDNHAWG